MQTRTLIRRGQYHDSVALMRLARELTSRAGVAQASVVMATEANKALLAQADLLAPDVSAAGPNDLVIAVRAADPSVADEALRAAEESLARRDAGGSATSAARPRSLRTAARTSPGLNVALISVPGQFAAAQAWDALRAGLHVFLFSDHVSVEDEIALKEYARTRGLFVMGPGAGTALLSGVGLGFANAVPRGPVGIAAAAGTGLQELSTLLAKDGVGVSQGIGTGGRDVSERVGGLMMLEAMRALEADPDTRVLLIVSKMPAPAVVDRIVGQAAHGQKPVVLALMGCDRDDLLPPPHATARTLRKAAALAAALARGEDPGQARTRLAREDEAVLAQARELRASLAPSQRWVRGLYSGGTLCEEAMRLWSEALGPVFSNAPFDPRWQLEDSGRSKQHTAVDLGEEEFTQGRPHPMIDPELRVQRLLAEARDPEVAAIVLDVVLGFGSHPDPAAVFGPAVAEARRLAQGRTLHVIASVTGTEQDPQVLSRQSAGLRQGGVIVMPSNAAAALLAAAIVKERGA